jgi:hypothetical protein
MTGSTPDQIRQALAFERLVDALLPGDGDFPSASAAGVHGVVLDRLRQRIGHEGIAQIARAIEGDEDIRAMTEAQVRDAVAAMQSTAPDLFAELRFVAYLSYYEAPPVIAALRALGHEYNDAPLPLGYTLSPFDPRPGADLPATPRGSYKQTDEIAPIDMSSLADLGLPRSGETR